MLIGCLSIPEIQRFKLSPADILRDPKRRAPQQKNLVQIRAGAMRGQYGLSRMIGIVPVGLRCLGLLMHAPQAHPTNGVSLQDCSARDD
jgi:hypothetical protein